MPSDPPSNQCHIPEPSPYPQPRRLAMVLLATLLVNKLFWLSRSRVPLKAYSYLAGVNSVQRATLQLRDLRGFLAPPPRLMPRGMHPGSRAALCQGPPLELQVSELRGLLFALAKTVWRHCQGHRLHQSGCEPGNSQQPTSGMPVF